MSFRNDLLSIGTGIGTVMFYDLRTMRFLETENERNFKLKTRGGWLVSHYTAYSLALLLHGIDFPSLDFLLFF